MNRSHPPAPRHAGDDSFNPRWWLVPAALVLLGVATALTLHSVAPEDPVSRLANPAPSSPELHFGNDQSPPVEVPPASERQASASPLRAAELSDSPEEDRHVARY